MAHIVGECTFFVLGCLRMYIVFYVCCNLLMSQQADNYSIGDSDFEISDGLSSPLYTQEYSRKIGEL